MRRATTSVATVSAGQPDSRPMDGLGITVGSISCFNRTAHAAAPGLTRRYPFPSAASYARVAIPAHDLPLACQHQLLMQCKPALPNLAHRFRSPNVNNSPTPTVNALANFSSLATVGAFTPRSTRLMKSTEQPTFFASCVCVSFLERRRSGMRCPSFFPPSQSAPCWNNFWASRRQLT